MKGRNIQKILRSLSTKEFEEFLLFVNSRHPAIREYGKFCKNLLVLDYSEEAALRILRVQRRVKNYRLEVLGDSLVKYLVLECDIAPIEGIIEASKRLALNLEHEAAIDLLKPAMLVLDQMERYDLLAKCWQVLSFTGSRISIECATELECYERQRVVAELDSLLLRIPSVRNLDSIQKRNLEFSTIRSESLIIFKKYKLGQRSLLTFLRIQARVGAILANENDWIKAQEAVIAQLEAHPWTTIDFELEVAKESRRLTQLYWQFGQKSKFWERFRQFSELKFSSPRASFEQIVSRFPFLFGIAIEQGDFELGMSAYSEFSKIIEDGKLDSNPSHLSISLYFCAYFLFVSGEVKDSKRMLFHLLKLPKHSILPTAFFASHFLQIAFEIEEREFDSADRLIRNLSNVSKIQIAPGVRDTILALRKVSRLGGTLGKNNWENLENELREELVKIQGKDSEAYFNLAIWIQAKKDGHLMLNLFKQEAAIKVEN